MTAAQNYSVLLNKKSCLWVTALLLVATSLPGSVRGQENPGLSGEEEITISDHALSKIRLLLEDFVPLPGATPGDTKAVYEVTANDLRLSDYFTVLPIPAMGEGDTLTATRSRALVRGSVEVSGGELVLHGVLESLPGRSLIFSKEYRAHPERYREAAHRFADDIVLYLTGEQGIAGTKIAFVGKGTGNKEIYVVDYDGYGNRRVTNNGSINLSPTWSPDGKKLAYVSYKDGDPDIFVVDLATGTERALVGGLGVQGAPAFSPDGKLLAFSHTAGRESEIYVCNAADGGNVRRVTRVGGINTSPAWSPDGSRLVFTSDRSGNPQLYLADADGGTAHRLTFKGKWNDIPDWSPRGNRIVFTARLDGQFRISTIDPSGLGEEQQQTYGPGSDEHPRWSPNGKHVVYSSSRGSKSLMVMDVDSRTNRILLNGGNYISPAWSPLVK